MKQAKKKSSYQQKKQKAYLVFMIPFLAGFFLLFLGIYVNSLRFSFCNLEMLGADGFALHFTGLDNYKFALLTDPDYMNNLRSALGSMTGDVIMAILYSLLIAVVLNGRMKGRTAFRAIFFIPVLVESVFVNKSEYYADVFSYQLGNM